MRPLPRCHNASRCYQSPNEHLDREVADRLQAMLLNGKTMAIFSPAIRVVVKLRGATASLWRSCHRPRRRGDLQTSPSALLPPWKKLAMNVVIAICIGKSSKSRNNNEPRNNETVKVLHNEPIETSRECNIPFSKAELCLCKVLYLRKELRCCLKWIRSMQI